ncbi:MAG: hypothetical protein IKH04_05355 [Kiritimatiellae bacterium]|nr:hypothetical protein [Kiritimatiellia bacterium]
MGRHVQMRLGRRVGDPRSDPPTMFDTPFAIALRLVGRDMGVSDYLDTGILNYQIPPSWFVDNG